MKDFSLVVPGLTHEAAVMRYQSEPWEDAHSHIPGSSALPDHASYTEWLNKITLGRSEETVPEGRVASDVYIAYAPSLDKVKGIVQIRHALNDYLFNFGGHIGYSVAPSERRKGYATIMLRDALLKCRELGLDRVLVTCKKDNIASAGVIEKCGGVLEDERIDSNGLVQKRYWITL
jgi:predicted acetyltransferase